jgi:hypothetical protein
VAYVIDKSRLFAKVAYAPNPAQRKIHESTAQHFVAAAGRRTGKSTAGGHELLPEVYRAHLNRHMLEEAGLRNEFWIVGPQYSDSEKEFRTFYNKCKRLKLPFDRPGTYYDPRGGDMQVSLWGGKFYLKGMSAHHPDQLVGEGLQGVIMAEAAKMKERIWTQMIAPTLLDFRGWAKFNSTPEGKNWFYDLFMKGVAADQGWASVRAPSWMNTAIFPGGFNDPAIQQLLRDLPTEMFNQEIAAKFSEYVGAVFKDWDDEWHVRREDWDPQRPVYVAADYGWTNPTVLLFIQVDVWDQVHIISEYYQTHKSNEDIHHDLTNGVYDRRHPALTRAARMLYPDPEDPKTSSALANLCRWRVMGDTGGELKVRIKLMRQWLKDVNSHLPHGHEDRQPRTIVDPSCTNTIREFGAYRYPETKKEAGTVVTEHPLEKDNHCPEAWGRFMRGHFGEGALVGGGGHMKVVKAKVKR